jgi:GNAT superfamily N-acetyltransferase
MKTQTLKVHKCDKQAINSILKGLNDYNLKSVPAQAPTWTPLEFVIKDDNGNVIAGILSGLGYWNGLEIKALWVHEDLRNKGIGTKLLKHTEKEAMAKGAVISMLDTFDFQAEEFYQKNGYQTIGEISDFPKGHKRVYLSKRLINPSREK